MWVDNGEGHVFSFNNLFYTSFLNGKGEPSIVGYTCNWIIYIWYQWASQGQFIWSTWPKLRRRITPRDDSSLIHRWASITPLPGKIWISLKHKRHFFLLSVLTALHLKQTKQMERIKTEGNKHFKVCRSVCSLMDLHQFQKAEAALDCNVKEMSCSGLFAEGKRWFVSDMTVRAITIVPGFIFQALGVYS